MNVVRGLSRVRKNNLIALFLENNVKYFQKVFVIINYKNAL
jgi:hypothetical protein